MAIGKKQMVHLKHQIGRYVISKYRVQVWQKEKAMTLAQGLLQDRRSNLMLRKEHELVRLATTAWGRFALGAISLLGNPFNGHTLEELLEQVERPTGLMPQRCHADRGYKGHGADIETCRVIITGSWKGISKAVKKKMERRPGIELEISHRKAEDKLGRNWLKGMLGDAQDAIPCAVGLNMRKTLAHRRRLFVLIWAWQPTMISPLPRILASEVGAA